MKHAVRCIALVILVPLVVTGCDSGPLGPERAIAPDMSYFNPQPDPPKEILRFTIDNTELLDWRGTITDGGNLEVTTQVATLRGAVLRLEQTWTFYPDGSDSRTATLSGQLNRTSGRLVMTGHDSHGGLALLQGWTSTSGGGSLGGEVMFNPQPDPPVLP